MTPEEAALGASWSRGALPGAAARNHPIFVYY